MLSNQNINMYCLSKWACLVEGFSTLVSAGVLNLPDKPVDPDCWLRSGFESPWRQLGFSLFLDPISCGRYTVERR